MTSDITVDAGAFCDQDVAETGDLTLLVGPAKYRYSVSAIALRVASPVWRALLNSGIHDTDNNEISFEEDDPEALRILLRIAHFQFREVPRTLPSFECLLRMATICDKYDTVPLVRLFITPWTEPYEAILTKAGNERYLWVAWVFGLEASFKKLANSLCRSVSTNENGDCLTPTGDKLDPNMLPPGYVDKLVAIRASAVKLIIDDIAEYWPDVLPTEPCCNSPKECHIPQMGTIIYFLQLLGWMQTKKIYKSLDDIYRYIIELKMMNPIIVHERCNQAGPLMATISLRIVNIASPIEHSDILFIREQSKK